MIPLAAAVAGAATMLIEVAGAQSLAPGFGTGLNAWAAMITVALGGLALGYALGGVVADRRDLGDRAHDRQPAPYEPAARRERERGDGKDAGAQREEFPTTRFHGATP